MADKPRHEHRGVSVGTVVMLLLTVLVLLASASILPRLMGTAELRMDAGSVLSALNLRDALPALSLSNIPITDATSVPEMTVTPLPTDTPAPTFTPVPSTPTPVPGASVTLTLGGSVTVDDGIRKSAYYSDSGKYDFTEILSLLAGEMRSDLTLVSLENLTDPDSKVSALNAPESAMDMLKAAGVDLVSLGFGKAYDRGGDALLATLNAAKARGIGVIGAYATQEEAETLQIFTIDNVDVAILHGVDAVSSAGKKGLRNDGTAWMLPLADEDTLLRNVTRAKQSGADVVIVSINWGSSSFKVNTRVKELAQQLADAGADVIVGTGTPAVQPVTWLTGKRPDGTIAQTLCAWSLGSLLNSGRNDGNVAGMLLQLQLSYDGTKVNFERVGCTPTYIWRFKDGGYHYRVIPSDQNPPDGMDSDHVKYMEKALRNIQKVLADSPVTMTR